jgi:hypothetical protein
MATNPDFLVHIKYLRRECKTGKLMIAAQPMEQVEEEYDHLQAKQWKPPKKKNSEVLGALTAQIKSTLGKSRKKDTAFQYVCNKSKWKHDKTLGSTNGKLTKNEKT